MPEHLRVLAGGLEFSVAWKQRVIARNAEAATITSLVEYRERVIAAYGAVEPLDLPAALRDTDPRVDELDLGVQTNPLKAGGGEIGAVV